MEKKSEMYLNSSYVDFIIEFKHKPEVDPFANNSSEGGSNPFACPIGPTLMILGQHTTYATLILSTQYYTHVFTVFIVKDYVRLIQWDCSGAIFTKPIYFNSESHLIDFFMKRGFPTFLLTCWLIMFVMRPITDLKLMKSLMIKTLNFMIIAPIGN